MEQELGSITRYCYDAFPCKVYTENSKEGFVTPSLYFPPLGTTDRVASFSTYSKTYTWSIKLFDKTSKMALTNAEVIADSIRSRRYLIPLVDFEGNLTGEYLRIKKVDTRESGDNIALIVLAWDSYYLYNKEVFAKMRTLYLTERVK